MYLPLGVNAVPPQTEIVEAINLGRREQARTMKGLSVGFFSRIRAALAGARGGERSTIPGE